jgi:serine/threonine-protein kinase
MDTKAGSARSKPEQIGAGATVDGKYHVVRLIGRGGYSIVYEAVHTTLGQRVALKFLEKEPDKKALDRFEQEARVAATIAHPNVCRSYDLGTLPSGTRYIVMERLYGESMYEMLCRERVLAPDLTVHIGSQVLAALEVAHKAHVIHRDIKPGNVFIEVVPGVEPIAKVLDFGLAKMIGAPSPIRTTLGRALGTPAYMSPEQVSGRQLDGRSDLFAVAVVLYEALSGRRPWMNASIPELCASILRDPAPPLNMVRPGLAPALVSVIHRALEKDPSKRFQSAGHFRRALQELGNMPRPSLVDAPGPLPKLGSYEDDSQRS